jgi:hypothetical protein
VRIDSARTPTTTATIGPPRSSDVVQVKVQAAAQLEVQVTTNMPGNRLTAGQPFEIQALVLNRGQAQYDNSGRLQFRTLPAGYGIVNDPKTFTEGNPAIWQATAPGGDQPRQDRFVIEMIQTPKDRNTRETAIVLADSAALVVEVNSAGAFLRKMVIVEPEGAKDSTLSTEQIFTLGADLRWQRVKNVKAQLILPPGLGFVPEPSNAPLETPPYTSTDDSTTAYWRIKAPAQSIERAVFRVELTSTDLSDPGTPLSPAVDSLTLKFVPLADLVFTAEVTNPPPARDRVVSAGQSFEVTAILNNSGSARAVGPDSIKLILPEGYALDSSVNTDFVKSSVPVGNQRRASWWVLAPNRRSPTPTGEVLTFSLMKVARDENTNQTARFNPSLTQFNVVVEERRLIVNALNTNRRSPVARGQDSLAVLDLELQNTGAGDNSSKILLNELQIYVKDQRGNNIAPGELLSALRLVDTANPFQVYGSVPQSAMNGNPVVMTLAQPVEVSFDASSMVTLHADLASTESVKAFSFGFQHSSNIVARDQDSDSLVTVTDAAGRTGSNFDVASILSVLVEASSGNFYNYPNPMRVGKSQSEGTRFVYFLPQDSDVSLEIYTMLGELVWQVKYLATEPQGRQGNHGVQTGQLSLPEITWDGFNGKGRKVLNGVYLAVLKTNSGTVTTKVAVVK